MSIRSGRSGSWPAMPIPRREAGCRDPAPRHEGRCRLWARRRRARPSRPRLPPPRHGRAAVTTDEEAGSPTSRSLIETEARHDAALVLEAPLPGGALKTGRKGVGRVHVGVTGGAAHAGVEPGKGVSAVRELARQVLRPGAPPRPGAAPRDRRRRRGPHPANVVPAAAQASVDVRAPTMAEAARVEAALRACGRTCRRAARDDRRLRAPADGAHPRRGGAQCAAQAAAAELGRTSARRDRRRNRRQLHRRAGRADPRRPGRVGEAPTPSTST